MTEDAEKKIREYERNNAFMAYNHIKVDEVSLTGAVVRVELVPESLSIIGMAHGGLIFSLVDIACGITARADGRGYVTQSANIDYLDNVSEGTIFAKASVVKRGHRIVVVHAMVSAEDGTALADAMVDMYCVNDGQSSSR